MSTKNFYHWPIVRWLVCTFGDASVYDPTPVFEVDITKPPIGPPSRVFRPGFGANLQTDLSKRTNRAWDEYNKKYRKALEKQMMDIVHKEKQYWKEKEMNKTPNRDIKS